MGYLGDKIAAEIFRLTEVVRASRGGDLLSDLLGDFPKNAENVAKLRRFAGLYFENPKACPSRDPDSFTRTVIWKACDEFLLASDPSYKPPAEAVPQRGFKLSDEHLL